MNDISKHSVLMRVGALIFMGLSTLLATAQNTQSAQDYAFSVSECENQNVCGTWSFNGAYGTGTWPDGQTASLIITRAERVGNHRFSITIHRVNTGDVNPSFKADYDGTMVNGEMAGTYKAVGSDSEHVWHAVPKDKTPPVTLPAVLNFCDVNCITFKLADGKYIGVNSSGGTGPGWSETIVVNRFTKSDVVLTRTLTGQAHFTVQYRGQIAPDGQSIVNARNPFYDGRSNQPMYARFNFASIDGSTVANSVSNGGGNVQVDWGNVFKGAEVVEKAIELIQNQEKINQSR
jgi:hypothetical protein